MDVMRCFVLVACLASGCVVYSRQPPPSYPPQQEPAQGTVGEAPGEGVGSVDYFYASLSPYGHWVNLAPYGLVFQPSQPGYAPYHDGYWSYTDWGFVWTSSEPFAWAVYHYGRWMHDGRAWYWIPDLNWGPSWVAWYEADDWVGWAPLPPDDGRWQIPEWSWRFVRWQHVLEPNVARYYEPPQQITVIYRRGRPLRRYARNPQGIQLVVGPAPEAVRQRGVVVRPNPLPPRGLGRLDERERREMERRAEEYRRSDEARRREEDRARERQQADERRRIEQDQKRLEQDRRRAEEEQRRLEQERKRTDEEARRRAEEQDRQRRMDEERRQKEEQRQRDEKEKRDRDEQDRQRQREEQEKRQRDEKEQRQRDEKDKRERDEKEKRDRDEKEKRDREERERKDKDKGGKPKDK